MNIKLLTKHQLEFLSLEGGCTGSSEPTRKNAALLEIMLRLKWRYFSALGDNISCGVHWKHLNETQRFYFLETMRSFVKIKSSRKGEITLSFTDAGKSCLSLEFLMSQICLLLNAICKNKIIAKISGFTVPTTYVFSKK